jgi:hypothetical protein
MRPTVSKQKTNASGIATFHSVSLNGLEFCLHPDSLIYESQELPYLFVSSQDAPSYAKSLNKVLTALPADVVFHVRSRTFGERLRYIFRNP